jgi:hypothetical protein
MYKCVNCGKGSQMGGKRRLLRGHYNPVSYSRKYPNLQWSKLNGKRALICTQCMKTTVKKGGKKK